MQQEHKTNGAFAHDSSVAVAPSPFGAYNRVYLVQATPSPKFLASLRTSYILKPLCETVLYKKNR